MFILPILFDRFYRQIGATESGTGLGLAIVKAIADRHKATVTLGDAPKQSRNGRRVRAVAMPHDEVRGPGA